MFRWITLSGIVLMLMLSACGHVQYRGGSGLATYSLSDPFAAPQYNKGEKSIGQIIMFDKENPKKAVRVFELRREKSRYMAETMLSESHDHAYKYPRRSFLSFGADHKQKNLGLQYRYEF